jgi:hypothetical protein
MRKYLSILALTLPYFVYAQDKLVKDLDGDSKADTVLIDADNSKIICRLSSKHFGREQSQPIDPDILNETSGIKSTKSGFEFYNNWMRAGYTNQFRYDTFVKKIRLIGMSRFEFGNAANDGSGESSINLLTGDYIGDWSYYDDRKQKLEKIPTIKTKMPFPVTYLESFSDKTYFDYADKCASLFNQQKTKLLKKEK